MKGDKLDYIENIVERCKPDIDMEYDPIPSWQNIQSRLGKEVSDSSTKKVVPLWMKLSSIAAVLMIGFMVGRATLPAINQSPIQAPIAEIQTHYNQEVDQQIRLVKAYDPDHAIIDEIALLDKQIELLKKDYQKANEFQRERILESMISNYQSRVDLLQNIISKLNKHSHDKITEI